MENVVTDAVDELGVYCVALLGDGFGGVGIGEYVIPRGVREVSERWEWGFGGLVGGGVDVQWVWRRGRLLWWLVGGGLGGILDEGCDFGWGGGMNVNGVGWPGGGEAAGVP